MIAKLLFDSTTQSLFSEPASVGVSQGRPIESIKG